MHISLVFTVAHSIYDYIQYSGLAAVCKVWWGPRTREYNRWMRVGYHIADV